MSILSRMYFYTLARATPQLEGLYETFKQNKLKDQDAGELEFLKVAKSFDRQESKQLGKAAPVAEKQPARMPASVKPAPAVKQDEAAERNKPAENAEGVAL
ncbi:MAG: hypothetical protein EOP09_13915 [Proteobacteria bacterium]|nr:MAG: hypothetical protein EOP09_13915 [Pseudomonadota bacterium]